MKKLAKVLQEDMLKKQAGKPERETDVFDVSDYTEAYCYQESEQSLWEGLYSMISKMASLGGDQVPSILEDLKHCIHNFPSTNSPGSTWANLNTHVVEPATSFNINDIEETNVSDELKDLRTQINNNMGNFLGYWSEIKGKIDQISWKENTEI